MEHIEKVREELRARGIEAGIEEIEVIKNAVPCTGIRIITPGQPQVSPVIYYSAEETVETVVDRILDVMEVQKPACDLSLLSDPDYVRSNLYVTVTHRHGEAENVLRREYLNLDQIMKLVVGKSEDTGDYVVKVTEDLVRMFGIDEEEAWGYAMRNSESTACIKNIAEFLGFMGGDPLPMYIATCNGGNDGASVLSFPDLFRVFCDEHGLEALTILPSSTQEVIVLPEEGVPARKALAAMVEEINDSIVDPLLQLDPVVYRYAYADNAIFMAED